MLYNFVSISFIIYTSSKLLCICSNKEYCYLTYNHMQGRIQEGANPAMAPSILASPPTKQNKC